MSNETKTLPQYGQYSGHQLCKNLTFLMDECRVSLTELHRNTGVPLATIQRLKTDPGCNPTIATLQPVADFFNISVGQLIGSEPISNGRTKGAYIQKKEKWIKLPMITWKDAINWPDIAPSKRMPMTSTDIDIGGNAFALPIEEDDWIGFQKDSIVIVDPNCHPENKDYVVVHKNGFQTATLKKYLCDHEMIYLAPLNNNFKTILLNEEYRILGVIRQIRKDIKKNGAT